MLGANPNPREVTLPPARERDWLIGQTAALLRHDGWRSYALAPMLEPTPTYFPDRWVGGEPSVVRLLRRLLRYAGHDDLEVLATLHDQDPARRGEVVGKPAMMRGKDPNAWFLRVREGRVYFAVEEIALREPENLVPALARAVAHAHRALVGLPTPEGLPGQRLIDLTGFTLGFGLLTTDASQRFYSQSAGGFRATRAEARLGALSVQDMSFLLALQAQTRGLDRRARRRLLSRLQPNQAGLFREAQTWLETLSPDVHERLGLPAPNHWPAPPRLEDLTRPLSPGGKPAPSEAELGPEVSGVYGELDEADEYDDDETDESESEEEDDEHEQRRDLDRGIRDANRGKPVFRIERSGALRTAKVLGFPVLMLGGLLSRGNFGVDVPMHIVMPVAAGLAVAGLAIGALFTDRRCSEPKCGTKLRVEDETCPLCAGMVMSVINSPKERLGAEEELAAEGKIDANGLVAAWVRQQADAREAALEAAELDDEAAELDDEPSFEADRADRATGHADESRAS